MTFDAYGDQATAGTRAYAYDALGRLAADTPASGGGGYAFSYVGSTGTIASDGTSGYAWDPSGGILAGTGGVGGGSGGALALTDIHGDQAGQFTPSGTTLAGSKAYDPWGAVTTASGVVTGMLGYQSAWADPASGKNLMGARWYAPGSGDFTSADTVQVSPDPDPAAGNPFAYAADDPLTGTDPSRHQVEPSGAGAVTPAMAKVNAAIGAAVRANQVKAAAAAAAAAHAAHLAHLAVVAREAPVVAKAAAKIPTYCGANNGAGNIGTLGTCMSAMFRAAGGAVDARGVPPTKGSSYNPKLASQAMGIVQKQYKISVLAAEAPPDQLARPSYQGHYSAHNGGLVVILLSDTWSPGRSAGGHLAAHTAVRRKCVSSSFGSGQATQKGRVSPGNIG